MTEYLTKKNNSMVWSSSESGKQSPTTEIVHYL